MFAELVPNRLYFLPTRDFPRSTETDYYMSFDKDLKYYPFAYDFGPVSLSVVYEL
jgi:hypothetical protein